MGAVYAVYAAPSTTQGHPFPCVFMRRHDILWPAFGPRKLETDREGRFGRRSSRIVDTGFGEGPFHALECIRARWLICGMRRTLSESRFEPDRRDGATTRIGGSRMPEQILRWAARAAVGGGLIVVVAAVVDWLAGVGSINDPMNPRWREAVALLAPGFAIASLGLAGIRARFTRHSVMGAGGAVGLVIGVLGFAASWTILHEYVFPLAPISMAMIFGGVIVLGVAMLRAATAPRLAIALLLCSPIGIFVAIGPPRPGVLILLFAAFGMACIWLGSVALRAGHRPRTKR